MTEAALSKCDEWIFEHQLAYLLICFVAWCRSSAIANPVRRISKNDQGSSAQAAGSLMKLKDGQI
jgi:hypothetical protein